MMKTPRWSKIAIDLGLHKGQKLNFDLGLHRGHGYILSSQAGLQLNNSVLEDEIIHVRKLFQSVVYKPASRNSACPSTVDEPVPEMRCRVFLHQ
jgi:hypothetical protein